jgi:hypothetical protein
METRAGSIRSTPPHCCADRISYHEAGDATQDRAQRSATVWDKMSDVIRFTAQISQVRTMADLGLRVVLDFDESNIEAATALMQAKQAGAILEIAAVPIIPRPVVKKEKPL